MISLLAKVCVYAILIVESSGIGDEYYSEDESLEEHTVYENRRRESYNNETTATVTANLTKPKTTENTKNTVSDSTLNYSEPELQNKTNITNFLRNLSLFSEWAYYDTITQSALRENPDYIENYKDYQISADNPIDLYNVAPAAEHINIDTSKSKATYPPYRVWYVPERYPCWELPLLYGKYKNKYSRSDIFYLYDENLDNVTEIYSKPKPKNDMSNINTDGGHFNKWCDSKPCYGDHTLCLFPSQVNSILCDTDYRVLSPSLTEQVAFINTINTMRNSVARGTTENYRHLPQATNIEMIRYDYDLEIMSKAWLRQCLPGVAPCSSLDNDLVATLECTKFADNCCFGRKYNCIPESRCFISPMLGCLHLWFWNAGDKLTKTDVECGYIRPSTYQTVQIIWATTIKVGCSYGKRKNGDVRVVCNFAPGAPYVIENGYYCGIIRSKNYPGNEFPKLDYTSKEFLLAIGINLHDAYVPAENEKFMNQLDKFVFNTNVSHRWGKNSLLKIYKTGMGMKLNGTYRNGTFGMIAKLVTKYKFHGVDSKCDSGASIYRIGQAGSACIQAGWRFHGLCHDNREYYPGYRAVAFLAPAAIFVLILYDLFSGVVNQANN